MDLMLSVGIRGGQLYVTCLFQMALLTQKHGHVHIMIITKLEAIVCVPACICVISRQLGTF